MKFNQEGGFEVSSVITSGVGMSDELGWGSRTADCQSRQTWHVNFSTAGVSLCL